MLTQSEANPNADTHPNSNPNPDVRSYTVEDIEQFEFYSTKIFLNSKSKEKKDLAEGNLNNSEIREMLNESKETQNALLRKVRKLDDAIEEQDENIKNMSTKFQTKMENQNKLLMKVLKKLEIIEKNGKK